MPHRLSGKLLISLALCLGAQSGLAQEARFSTFGTFGYAISDREYRYQRFIDSDGTISRDSRLGVQMDLDLAPAWRATAQLRLAPSSSNDKEWSVELPWAFVSWRPNNEWLVRAGKTRLPILLFSETLDVGTTYPFARLPIEAYTITPTEDFYGLALTRSWLGASTDVDLDAFAGWGHAYWRVYLRDTPLYTPNAKAGPWFEGIGGPIVSTTLTVRQDENRFRFTAVAWETKFDTLTFGTSYPYVPLAPGVGYYQVFPAMPGPGVGETDRVSNFALAVGAEVALPAGFKTVGEGVWRSGQHINVGAGSHGFGGYLSLQRRVGPWTPYVYGAWMRSSEYARNLYSTLDANRIPDAVPYAAQLNALQRWGADSAVVVDQRTWAAGGSYAAAPGQVVKMEWQRTRTGLTSPFIDAPLGTSSGGQRLDVFSLSYNFAF